MLLARMPAPLKVLPLNLLLEPTRASGFVFWDLRRWRSALLLAGSEQEQEAAKGRWEPLRGLARVMPAIGS